MTPIGICLLGHKDDKALDVWSRLHNGLPCMKVCGATNFANPYEGKGTAAEKVALYKDMLNDPESRRARWIRDNLHRLRGHNLACTCAKGTPCHRDVLLALANAPAESGTS